MLSNNYFDLLIEFIKTDFKHRYKNSALGFLWMILKPLAIFSILYFIWTYVFKSGDNNSLFLLSGIMISQYFNDGILLGMQCLENKAHIILKINFPREVVIFSSTSVALINFAVNYLILLLFTLLSGEKITVNGMLLNLFSVITIYTFILAISFFTSTWNILMKDIHHLIELVLQMIFWGTPILYDLNALPPKIQKYIKLNPLTHILDAFRTGLIHAGTVTTQDYIDLSKVFFIILLIAILGYIYFKYLVKRIAEHF